MRSPALAFAWELRQRHRWGVMAIAAYLAALAIIRIAVVPGQRVSFENAESFAFAVVVPLTSTVLYFLAVFSFGVGGDLAARQSMYPARMFTLPVTTSALAGWPMLYGSAAMAMLWMATRLLGVWPSGARVPLFWPLLLGPALLAWTQALTWMPYPLRGLRVIVTVLWLAVIDAVVMTALELKASEAVMIALLAPHVPLAYLTARFAVARARRGDVPDWRSKTAKTVVNQPREHFSSAARAQEWLEWRQHGRSLPFLVAMLLPFELMLLFAFRDTPVIVFEVLAIALLTPAFMATFVAARAGGVTPFIAARPLANASLIGAKWKVAMASTLAAWLLVLVATPIALRLSGASAVVMDWARDLDDAVGTTHAVALSLLLIVLLIASTWKQLVQSLYVGMSGREWLIKASVFVPLTILAVVLPVGHWVLQSKSLMARLWYLLPWIAAALVCIKIAAAAWVSVRLHDRRLLSERALVGGAACWTAIVFAFYGLLLWLVPAVLVPKSILMLIAILAVPLARLSAAPLALAWSRHR